MFIFIYIQESPSAEKQGEYCCCFLPVLSYYQWGIWCPCCAWQFGAQVLVATGHVLCNPPQMESSPFRQPAAIMPFIKHCKCRLKADSLVYTKKSDFVYHSSSLTLLSFNCFPLFSPVFVHIFSDLQQLVSLKWWWTEFLFCFSRRTFNDVTWCCSILS